MQGRKGTLEKLFLSSWKPWSLLLQGRSCCKESLLPNTRKFRYAQTALHVLPMTAPIVACYIAAAMIFWIIGEKVNRANLHHWGRSYSHQMLRKAAVSATQVRCPSPAFLSPSCPSHPIACRLMWVVELSTPPEICSSTMTESLFHA